MDLAELKRLAGIQPTEENISITGTEKARLQKKHNIQPGTEEWFRLWFSKPKMTGEKPISEHIEVKWTAPDFDTEYGEVEEAEGEMGERYHAHFPDKETWLEKAKEFGSEQKVERAWNVQNTDAFEEGDPFARLDLDKQKSITDYFANPDPIMLPIILHDRDGFILIGGNTRLTYATKLGYTPMAWVIDLTSINEGGVGKIVKGVNTTPDVKVGQDKIEQKKFFDDKFYKGLWEGTAVEELDVLLTEGIKQDKEFIANFFKPSPALIALDKDEGTLKNIWRIESEGIDASEWAHKQSRYEAEYAKKSKEEILTDIFTALRNKTLNQFNDWMRIVRDGLFTQANVNPANIGRLIDWMSLRVRYGEIMRVLQKITQERQAFIINPKSLAKHQQLNQTVYGQYDDGIIWMAQPLVDDFVHLFSLQLRSIKNYVPDPMDSLNQYLKALKDIELAWTEAGQTDDKRHVKHDDGESLNLPQEIILQDETGQVKKLDGNLAWFDLNKEYCEIEGNAMGHCGNSAAATNDDTVLSLREMVTGKQDTWIPHATFILNKRTGMVGEMKGYGNRKPADKYHPAILALLMYHPAIKGLVGGGYLEEENFHLIDDVDRDGDKRMDLEWLEKNKPLMFAQDPDTVFDLVKDSPKQLHDWLYSYFGDSHGEVKYDDNQKFVHLAQGNSLRELLNVIYEDSQGGFAVEEMISHMLNDALENDVDHFEERKQRLRDFINNDYADMTDKKKIDEIDPEAWDELVNDSIERAEGGAFESAQDHIIYQAIEQASEEGNLGFGGTDEGGYWLGVSLRRLSDYFHSAQWQDAQNAGYENDYSSWSGIMYYMATNMDQSIQDDFGNGYQELGELGKHYSDKHLDYRIEQFLKKHDANESIEPAQKQLNKMVTKIARTKKQSKREHDIVSRLAKLAGISHNSIHKKYHKCGYD